MADVFISYKSERRPAARHLATIIEAHGFSVWFDYDLVPGKNFGRRIEEELRQAKAVVVLWCPLSVQSEWVQDEADLAKKLGLFVPARIETCDPPLGFRRDDYVDISAWDGDPSTRSLDRLIDRIETLVDRESTIARRRLIDLHNNWSMLGRPTLAQFALRTLRGIADEERRLPSRDTSVSGREEPATVPDGNPTRDYAFWKAEWEAHRSGSDLPALKAIAEHAPPYFAIQARARIAEIEAERERQAKEKAAIERQEAIPEKNATAEGMPTTAVPVDLRLFIGIDKLNLSIRTSNCLISCDAVLLGDIVSKSEAECLGLPNFGRRSLNEVKEVLARLGLALNRRSIRWPLGIDEIDSMAQIGGVNSRLFIKVSQVDVSERAKLALRGRNVFLVGDLVQMSEEELLRTANFGRKSANEVKVTLAALGFGLGMQCDSWPFSAENISRALRSLAQS